MQMYKKCGKIISSKELVSYFFIDRALVIPSLPSSIGPFFSSPARVNKYWFQAPGISKFHEHLLQQEKKEQQEKQELWSLNEPQKQGSSTTSISLEHIISLKQITVIEQIVSLEHITQLVLHDLPPIAKLVSLQKFLTQNTLASSIRIPQLLGYMLLAFMKFIQPLYMLWLCIRICWIFLPCVQSTYNMDSTCNCHVVQQHVLCNRHVLQPVTCIVVWCVSYQRCCSYHKYYIHSIYKHVPTCS